MKKYLLIASILIAETACKKGSEPVKTSTNIVGKWEIRKEFGGGFGGSKTFAPGNGTTFQFNADSTFSQYQAFTLTNHGTYSVVTNPSSMPQVTYTELYLNHQPYNIMQLKSDTLYIGTSAADGLEDIYVKQN